MLTPASIAGHPIHPMLVPVAIGGFVLSLAFDIVCSIKGAPPPNIWSEVAFYTMIGGLCGALLATVPGLIDLLSLPPGGTKKIALAHMGINLTVVALYLVNAYLRFGEPADLKIPMVMSGIGVFLLLISGWLGGKMVFESGVGVSNRT